MEPNQRPRGKDIEAETESCNKLGGELRCNGLMNFWMSGSEERRGM
jgi:hypothetical protein